MAGTQNSSPQKNSVTNLCAEKFLLKDSILQQRIRKAFSFDLSLEVVPKDEPCLHNRFISNAINRTFFIDIFNIAIEHTYFKLKKGEDPFSIDIFTLQDKQTAQEIEKTILKRKINNLQIESPIFYSFFVMDNRLIIILADRLSYNNHKSLFKELEQVISKHGNQN